ncbi:MAG: class I SAM-dependent methyltransferase [Verrucomicrobia bacterium]|nr:class I SAM-dependent methyltransferase [Verrucomicrobiota bacterium]MBV8273914.1 class I SAM-dependent methyltransferase [Verrucomicrobiota bacterium]
MNNSVKWRDFWEENAAKSWSDYEYDHGKLREQEIEDLSKRELLAFIDPQPADTILDVGCGTGSNELLLHSRVKRVIGMDYTTGALDRCRRHIETYKIENVELVQGDATQLPSPDHAVDKVLCMSVFQYLDDAEVRTALKEFSRVLKSGGTLVLHVKNKSSLYLSTLCAAKKLKMFLKRPTKLEHIRPYRWYIAELKDAGFEVLAYNSFNIIMIELIPIKWRLFLQKWELKRHNKFPLRIGFLRRSGADLKIKARPLAKP